MANEQTTALIASKATNWLQQNIKEGVIKPLAGYDMGAEISSAMLIIAQTNDKAGRPALQVCSQESIILALRDMAIQGLSMVRKQCYPIVYGNTLQLQRSYFGTSCVLSRMFPNLTITANVLYQGDEYEYCYDELGEFNYIKMKSSKLENRDNPIMAAYGSLFDNGTGKRVYGCVMSWSEIQRSWAKAKTHNVQNDFPQEMAKRTLIQRMCKMYVNCSPTIEPMLADAYNRTTENEYDNSEPKPSAEAVEIGKAIRSKSQGAAGLEGLIKATQAAGKQEATEPKPQEKPTEPSIEVGQEFIPPQEENEPETQEMPLESEQAIEGDSLFGEDELPEDEYTRIPF